MKSFRQHLLRAPWLQILAGILILLGLVFRFGKYLINRSLWLDEAMIALNIIDRSPLEFLQPLDFNQAAPFGFMLLEKFVFYQFGKSEYALRAIPLLASVGSLVAFYLLARRLLKPFPMLLALALFSLSPFAIYYASELKHYSLDTLVAILLLLMMTHVKEHNLTMQRSILYGVAGFVSIWFSFPAVFLLAGFAISQLVYWMVNKRWKEIQGFFLVCILWLISFIAYYFLALAKTTQNIELLNYWKHAFMPLPLTSGSDLKWIVGSFVRLFRNPAGMADYAGAPLLFFVGLFSFLAEDVLVVTLLVSPILLALIASGFKVYPFSGRLLLFLVPLLMIPVAQGTERLIILTKKYRNLLGFFLVILIIFHPLNEAITRMKNPLYMEELRPLMDSLREEYQEGDIIYLYYGAKAAFKYYQSDFGFADQDFIIGVASRGNQENYLEDIRLLKGNERIWFVFSHVYKVEDEFFLESLDSMGVRRRHVDEYGADLYLYDLSQDG